MIPRRSLAALVGRAPRTIAADARRTAARIVADVERDGEAALRRHAERLGDLAPGAPLYHDRADMRRALRTLPREDRRVLERTASRIRRFARAQRQSLRELSLAIDGGMAGHAIAPVERAGCYAPGGRYPLPSSALMTLITAREAGVTEVWLASPRPATVTLAAAELAAADGVLAVGGAQAIAALARGCGPLPPVDLICGPGNRYVTAAKQLVSDRVAIDLLAGPSELVVWADGSADPDRVAAELIAQAEHDPESSVILVTTSARCERATRHAVRLRLDALGQAAIARVSLRRGATVLVGTTREAARACDALAPEHLAIHGDRVSDRAAMVRHYGALFAGDRTSVALGDYGAGPNHVLPTSGSARRTGGLSVLSFLRVRTWLRMDRPAPALYRDAARLAELEGLAAHASALTTTRLAGGARRRTPASSRAAACG